MKVAYSMGKVAKREKDISLVIPYLKVAVEETADSEEEGLLKKRAGLLPDYALYVTGDRNEAVALKKAAQPEGWLPFASDADLVEWRERVIGHAMSDRGWRTAKAFALHMGRRGDDLYAVVRSQEAMDREVFSVVPREVLGTFQRQTHGRCIRELDAYLAPLAS